MTQPRLLLTCLWLALCPLTLPIVAQEANAEKAPASSTAAEVATPERALELLRTVQQRDVELAAVAEEIKGADGEDAALLRGQFDELTDQQFSDLDRLISVTSSREKAGKDVTQLKLQSEQLLKRSSRRLRNRIQSFEQYLRDRGTNRESMEPTWVNWN